MNRLVDFTELKMRSSIIAIQIIKKIVRSFFFFLKLELI